MARHFVESKGRQPDGSAFRACSCGALFTEASARLAERALKVHMETENGAQRLAERIAVGKVGDVPPDLRRGKARRDEVKLAIAQGRRLG